MTSRSSLPPGQRWLHAPMPRFGLTPYVRRWADPSQLSALGLYGELQMPLAVPLDRLAGLPRLELVGDFHCVTTWSVPALRWEGWRFSDFWNTFVHDLAHPEVDHVMFTGMDGYATCIPLTELMTDEVLLADRLNGEALSTQHGAPLRLVIPHLYGYKNVKHLKSLELLCGPRASQRSRVLIHPRGRVDLEERSGVGLPIVWRMLYRALLPQFLEQVRNLQHPPEPRPIQGVKS